MEVQAMARPKKIDFDEVMEAVNREMAANPPLSEDAALDSKDILLDALYHPTDCGLDWLPSELIKIEKAAKSSATNALGCALQTIVRMTKLMSVLVYAINKQMDMVEREYKRRDAKAENRQARIEHYYAVLAAVKEKYPTLKKTAQQKKAALLCNLEYETVRKYPPEQSKDAKK
jgi:hypothetical protein